LEIAELKVVPVNLYSFEVEEWQIPSIGNHLELNSRILGFLRSSDMKLLKIVYLCWLWQNEKSRTSDMDQVSIQSISCYARI
jgi:hypothetical protein